MFSKIFSIFSSKQAASPSTQAPAAAVQAQFPNVVQKALTTAPSANDTKVVRDEGMIKKLTDDHRALLTSYGAVMRHADDGQWQDVQQKLLGFKSLLTDHLLLETVKVYSYLKNRYRDEEEIFASIHDFSTEMNGIRKHVVNTLATYSDIAVNAEKQQTFSETWRSIGIALSSRIQREETSLYTLY